MVDYGRCPSGAPTGTVTQNFRSFKGDFAENEVLGQLLRY
jgi:hypothetical protein